MDEHKLRQEELDAWHEVCKELRNLGIDINSQDSLCNLLIKWGESLARLRKVKL